MKNTNHSSDDYEEEKFDIEEEKRKKSTFAERVTVVLFQRMDPNTNESFATKTQK